jgi:hypothetical protein
MSVFVVTVCEKKTTPQRRVKKTIPFADGVVFKQSNSQTLTVAVASAFRLCGESNSANSTWGKLALPPNPHA